MPIETTYSQAQTDFDALCDYVTKNREVVIIHRQGADTVAMIAADELSSLLETVHLLRSPKNAKRLFRALNRASQDEAVGKPDKNLLHLLNLLTKTRSETATDDKNNSAPPYDTPVPPDRL